MHAFADSLISSWFGADPATWPYAQAFYAAVMAVFAILIVGVFALPVAGIATWAERKIAGRIQSRIGPNRQGPMGFLVWLADGVKLILKEDLIPKDADNILYRVAPYLVMLGLALVFVVLPFGAGWVVADMNVALFFIIAVTGLEVVGVILAGWSSNSKWSLLGGFRSAAQLVSYEIPMALAFMMVAVSVGSLGMQDIVKAQGGLPWEWMIFRSPMHFVAFFIYYIAALAEGNRTPFDLPEAESELVSGFNTEYSGFRFAVFFVGEYANIWIINALAVLLFLGGWQIPFVAAAKLEAMGFWGGAFSFLWFAAKVAGGFATTLWIRWTLPRVRLDQMMDLCWKYLVPIGLASLILAAGWELVIHAVPVARWIMTVPLTVLGVGLVFAFFRLTVKNVGKVGDQVSMENW